MRWALLGLLVLLPLQWFVIPGVPLGQGRLHLVALVAFLFVVLLRHRLRAARPVLRVCLPFVLAEIALLVIWVATGLYHGERPLEPFQDALYLAVMLAVGTVVYRIASGRAGVEAVNLLRWSIAAAALSLLVGLSLSMAINGVNPAQVFVRMIAAGDPQILQQELFRTAFGGFGFDADDVSGNDRHEVFGAVLAALYVSAWAVRLNPLTRRWQLVAYRASVGLAVALLLVSMSRAVLLAALVWPLVALFRSITTGSLKPGQLALVALAVVSLLAAIAAGFAQVIWIRFTQETSSYEARDGLIELAIENIRRSPATGGFETAGASSHNLVLDSWQRAGFIAALAATVMVVLLLGLFASLVVRIGAEPAWMLPVAAALALPLVRIFTAGGGVITPVSWVVLGFVAGAVAHRMASVGRGGDGAPGGQPAPSSPEALSGHRG